MRNEMQTLTAHSNRGYIVQHIFQEILKQAVYFINSASDISVYVLYSSPANYFLFASFLSLKRNLQYVYVYH